MKINIVKGNAGNEQTSVPKEGVLNERRPFDHQFIRTNVFLFHTNTISHTGGLSTDFCLNLAKISIILADGLFDGFRVNPLLLRYFSSGDMMPSSSLDRSWLHL
jgi:hypothetical protein